MDLIIRFTESKNEYKVFKDDFDLFKDNPWCENDKEITLSSKIYNINLENVLKCIVNNTINKLVTENVEEVENNYNGLKYFGNSKSIISFLYWKNIMDCIINNTINKLVTENVEEVENNYNGLKYFGNSESISTFFKEVYKFEEKLWEKRIAKTRFDFDPKYLSEEFVENNLKSINFTNIGKYKHISEKLLEKYWYYIYIAILLIIMICVKISI